MRVRAFSGRALPEEIHHRPIHPAAAFQIRPDHIKAVEQLSIRLFPAVSAFNPSALSLYPGLLGKAATVAGISFAAYQKQRRDPAVPQLF